MVQIAQFLALGQQIEFGRVCIDLLEDLVAVLVEQADLEGSQGTKSHFFLLELLLAEGHHLLVLLAQVGSL